MKIWISRLVFLLLLCGCLVWLLPALLVHVLNYEDVIGRALATLHRPDLEIALRTRFFTPAKFAQLRLLLPVMAVVGLASAVLVWYKRKSMQQSVSGYLDWWQLVWQNILATWRSTSRPTQVFFLLLLIAVAIRSFYYASTWDVQYDEAWNYNYFLGQQWWYSLVAYNNYPLHNLVAWPSVHLLPAFPNLAMRLPGILAGLISCFGVFALAQRLWRNEYISLLCSAVFACLPVSVFYMLYARGVMFEILFVLPITYLIIRAMQQPMQGYTRFSFVWLQALGTFSMLSHPYFMFFSGLGLVGSQLKPGGRWWQYSLLLVASVLASLVLLLPVMMGTGLGLGIQVATGQLQINPSLLLHKFEDNSLFISGWRYSFYLFALVNLLLLLFRNTTSRATALLNLCLLTCPLLIPVLTHTIPPERALGFLVIVPVLTTGLVLFHLPALPRYGYATLTLGLAALLSWSSHTHKFLNWSRKKDKAAKTTAHLLMQQNVHSLYNDCEKMSYYLPAIDYYYQTNGQRISFYSSDPVSTRYTPASEAHRFDVMATCCPDSTVTPPNLLTRFYGVCLIRPH